MHIFAYYDWLWNQNPQLYSNLLRRGYHQWACGVIEYPTNNLY